MAAVWRGLVAEADWRLDSADSWTPDLRSEPMVGLGLAPPRPRLPAPARTRGHTGKLGREIIAKFSHYPY